VDRLHFIEACIRLAEDVDADAVSFWSGTPVEETQPKILMARLVEACHRLCDFAEGRRMRLAFEPEPGMFIDTIDKFAELHGRVDRPNFGLTLDVGHLQCNGELPIGDHIRKYAQWLWNFHIEDMRRGAHDHLMFGEGEIDFADVTGALKEIDYRGGVYVELSRHSHNAVETARKSMEFLRPFVPERSRAGKGETNDVVAENEAERHQDVDQGVVLPPASDEPR
jgi:sugar phosphate isomerase/epimerase